MPIRQHPLQTPKGVLRSQELSVRCDALTQPRCFVRRDQERQGTLPAEITPGRALIPYRRAKRLTLLSAERERRGLDDDVDGRASALASPVSHRAIYSQPGARAAS